MTHRVINTHDQLVAAGGGVAIMVSYGGIRERYTDGYSVYRLNAQGQQLVTDPKAHYSQHGCKWFSNFKYRSLPFHERQRRAFEDARRWVAAQGWYTGAWARNRLGDYVPVEIHKRFPLVARHRRKQA